MNDVIISYQKDTFFSPICKPAFIYLVIALIMLCIGVLLKLSMYNIAITASQFFAIIICTLLLMGICEISPEISWVITGIFIICTTCFLGTLIVNSVFPRRP